MKVKNLKKVLSLVKKPSLSILSAVKIKGDKGRTTAYVITDKLNVVIDLGQTAVNDFEVLVDAKLLKALIKDFNKVELKDAKLWFDNIQVSVANYQLDKFPEVTISEFTIQGSFTEKDFEQVRFSVSKNDSRRFVSGVFIDKGALVTTDGKRLSLLQTNNPETDGFIPIEAVDLVSSIGSEFGYSAKKDEFYFSNGEVIIKGHMIDGDFPPYRKVIPEHDSYTEFRIPNWKEISTQIKPYVDKQSRKVIFNDNIITAENLLLGTIELTCNTGIDMKFALNFDFLNDIMNLDDPVFYIKDSMNSIVVKTSNSKYIHVVMPMTA